MKHAQANLIGSLIAAAGSTPSPVAAAKLLQQAIVLLAQVGMTNSTLLKSPELDAAVNASVALSQHPADTPAAIMAKGVAMAAFNNLFAKFSTIPLSNSDKMLSDGLQDAQDESLLATGWDALEPLIAATAACGWAADRLGDRAATALAKAAARWVDRVHNGRGNWLVPDPVAMQQVRSAISSFDARLGQMRAAQSQRSAKDKGSFRPTADGRTSTWWYGGLASAVALVAIAISAWV